MNFTSPIIHPKNPNRSPIVSKSNSSKIGKFLNFNSSIRKYLNINIEKESISKPALEFSHFIKTPLKKDKSFVLKKENTSPLHPPIKQEPQQSMNMINETNFSAFSKASYDSYKEEINFDHCQYIEIMHNMQKGPLKLYSKAKNNKSMKSLKLMEMKLSRKPEKKEISDFAGFANKINPMMNNSKKMYICKYCQAAFSKPCALGGHMSKLHKGRSKFFKKRKEKREMRETERQRNTFFKTIFKSNCL